MTKEIYKTYETSFSILKKKKEKIIVAGSSIVNEVIRTFFVVFFFFKENFCNIKKLVSCFGTLFFTQNLILKNEFVLITSFTILLMCTPLTPPSYGELFSTELAPIFLRHSLIFIYVHLFLFVRTSFYLSEPILICQNLFLFVKTYFHLCALIFVCENLFLFMIIFENLFLFMIICENLFSLSLYEKKQVYEHHHLKQIFCHQNMIMIFW